MKVSYLVPGTLHLVNFSHDSSFASNYSYIHTWYTSCCCCSCCSHINSSPQYNALRGRRTGSNNSEVEEIPRIWYIYSRYEYCCFFAPHCMQAFDAGQRVVQVCAGGKPSVVQCGLKSPARLGSSVQVSARNLCNFGRNVLNARIVIVVAPPLFRSFVIQQYIRTLQRHGREGARHRMEKGVPEYELTLQYQNRYLNGIGEWLPVLRYQKQARPDKYIPCTYIRLVSDIVDIYISFFLPRRGEFPTIILL